MIFLFWGLTVTMTVVAIAFVVVSPGNGKPLLDRPRILAAATVPLIAIGVYLLLGSPNAVTNSGSRVFHTKPDQPTRAIASVGSLVDGLRARLQQEPNDAGGWLLLARSYQHLDRHEEALLAYERTRSLGKTDMEFEKLLPDRSLPVQQAVVDSGRALRGRVELSPAAAHSVYQDDTIFILAKESPDHRMPVVALRKPAADLPIDFVLTDEHAMVPGTRLADFETLVVTARVSRSGLANYAIEGLEVWSKPVSPNDDGKIDLLITSRPQPEEHQSE